MSNYDSFKRQFIARIDAVGESFHKEIENMDLDNVSVKEEMVEVAQALSNAINNAKSILP